NWTHNGREILESGGSGFGIKKFFDKKHLVWSGLSSGPPSFRWDPDGWWFDDASPAIIDESLTSETLGFLNSTVSKYMLNLINPTVNYQAGDVKKLPIADSGLNSSNLEKISESCV